MPMAGGGPGPGGAPGEGGAEGPPAAPGDGVDAWIRAPEEPVKSLQIAAAAALDEPVVFHPIPLRGRLHERGRSGVAVHHVASLIPPAMLSFQEATRWDYDTGFIAI